MGRSLDKKSALAVVAVVAASASAAISWIRSRRNRGSKQPPKVLMAGAPAAGKGTQCEKLVNDYGLVHVSAGDILREEKRNGTAKGKQAHNYMEKGELVPDELIVDMVLERLETQEAKKNGWLLDGFPRSEGQCKAMQSRGIEPTRFIVLDVPTETLVERVSGRRTDPETGKVYHMKFSPPENEEIKKRLEQRSDDSEEKVRKRDSDFRKYIQEISPYFQKQKKTIDGNRGVDQVYRDVKKAIFE